jgi:hypothetical protein
MLIVYMLSVVGTLKLQTLESVVLLRATEKWREGARQEYTDLNRKNVREIEREAERQ